MKKRRLFRHAKALVFHPCFFFLKKTFFELIAFFFWAHCHFFWAIVPFLKLSCHSWNYRSLLETIFFFLLHSIESHCCFFSTCFKKNWAQNEKQHCAKKKFVFLLCLIGWPLVFAFSWKMVCFFWRGCFFFSCSKKNQAQKSNGFF